MKTHLYAQIKNEAFILPYFLQHYNWVDEIYLFDNYSTDATCAIASKYANVCLTKEYGRTQYVETDLRDFKNEIWKASRGKADYVIVCDADEFLMVQGLKRTAIRVYLQALLDAGVQIPQVQNGYEMVSNNPRLPYKYLCEYLRTGIDAPLYAKQIIFSLNIDAINYTVGAHTAQPQGNDLRTGGKLSLWHYKYIGGLARLQKHYQDRESGMNALQKENKWASQWYRSPEDLAYDYVVHLRGAKLIE